MVCLIQRIRTLAGWLLAPRALSYTEKTDTGWLAIGSSGFILYREYGHWLAGYWLLGLYPIQRIRTLAGWLLAPRALSYTENTDTGWLGIGSSGFILYREYGHWLAYYWFLGLYPIQRIRTLAGWLLAPRALSYTENTDTGWLAIGSSGFILYKEYGHWLARYWFLRALSYTENTDTGWLTIGSSGFILYREYGHWLAGYWLLGLYPIQRIRTLAGWLLAPRALSYTENTDTGWLGIGSSGFILYREYGHWLAYYWFLGLYPIQRIRTLAGWLLAPRALSYTENTDTGWLAIGSSGFILYREYGHWLASYWLLGLYPIQRIRTLAG